MQNLLPKFEIFATKQLVADEVSRVKNAISSEIRGMESKFSAMMTSINGLMRRIENKDAGHASTSSGTERNLEIRRVEQKLGKEIETLQAKNTRLETKLREKTELLERCHYKMEQIDQSVAILMTRFEDLEPRERLQTKINYNGVLLWKIEDFHKKRQDAISGVQRALYSDYFYTSEFGYKMCAKIYMNGDGFGKGTHLSLFFVVMKGEYDALQTWPLQKKITMILLDQGSGDHMVDAFHSDPQSSSFKRPTSGMNIASGSPLFIPIENLNNRQYIKDDLMFIKIIVE